MNENNCIFCKIVKNEIEAVTIYEDEEFKVFLDAFPATKGHVLIVPKEHVTNIFELDEEKAGRLFALASKIAKNIKEKLDIDGLNVVQNNGEIAGQTVFHFHLHLIPRYKDDKVIIKWATEKTNSEQLKELQEKLSM